MHARMHARTHTYTAEKPTPDQNVALRLSTRHARKSTQVPACPVSIQTFLLCLLGSTPGKPYARKSGHAGLNKRDQPGPGEQKAQRAPHVQECPQESLNSRANSPRRGSFPEPDLFPGHKPINQLDRGNGGMGGLGPRKAEQETGLPGVRVESSKSKFTRSWHLHVGYPAQG